MISSVEKLATAIIGIGVGLVIMRACWGGLSELFGYQSRKQKATKISTVPPFVGAAYAPSTAFDSWHAAKYGGTFKEMHQRGFDMVADSQMLLMERIKEYVSETCQGGCRPACGPPEPPDERDLFDAWFAREFSSKPRRNNRGYKSQQVAHMYKAWKAAKGIE